METGVGGRALSRVKRKNTSQKNTYHEEFYDSHETNTVTVAATGYADSGILKFKSPEITYAGVKSEGSLCSSRGSVKDDWRVRWPTFRLTFIPKQTFVPKMVGTEGDAV